MHYGIYHTVLAQHYKTVNKQLEEEIQNVLGLKSVNDFIDKLIVKREENTQVKLTKEDMINIMIEGRKAWLEKLMKNEKERRILELYHYFLEVEHFYIMRCGPPGKDFFK